MAKFLITKKAIQDLSEIWEYTYDKWSEKQADKYYFMLLDYCEAIAENPAIGKKYSSVMEELQGFRIAEHIIFYRLSTMDTIEVLRILHARMDLKGKEY